MRHNIKFGRKIVDYLKQISLAAGVGLLSLTSAGGYTLLTAGVALAAPAAPANVQAVTGGNNIAVVWDLSTSSNVAKYEVWRNSVKVATVTPGQGVLAGYIKGNRYIDNNVTAGATYSYQLDAVGTDGTTSPLTTAVSATQPAVGSTTAVPTITLDTAAAPDLLNYLQTQILPELHTWYPKIGDAYAHPGYTPATSFTIKLDTANTGIAGTVAGVINVNPAWLRSNQADGGGMFVHEATHILQAYPVNPIGWFTEGMADSQRDFFTRERSPRPPLPNDKLTDGYGTSAAFINWIAAHYDSTIIRKLNIALHNNTYTSNFWVTDTGKTDVQLWNEMRNQYFGSSAPIVGINSKCVDTPNATPGAGVNLQIYTCNSSVAQQWGVRFDDITAHDTTKGFSIINSSLDTTGNYCLDVTGSGTTDGTVVWQYSCNNGLAQDWKTGANGSLINPNSGKCLQPVNGASTDGTGLEIRTCNGSAAQNWKLWGTTNSAIDQRYATDQTFRTNLGYPTAAETISGIYASKVYSNGRAYNTSRSGVHEVHGAIATQYVNTGAATAWGEPTTDQKPTPDGVGQFNEFYGAGTSGIVSIYWSPSTSAHVIHGAIRDQWGTTGWEIGIHGYPTSDEISSLSGAAHHNTFQNGGIFWSSSTGARSVYGAIYTDYGTNGYETGALGLPTTSETGTPDGTGRYNQFQNGAIYWTPGTGAHAVQGAIKARWAALGWETSYLGYPTSDEFAITGGRRSNFQNGYITWDSSTGVVSDFHY